MSDKPSGTSEQVPRSGSDLQPRVAAPATLGDEFQFASTLMGLRPLPCPYNQRRRRPATLGWRSLPLRGMKLASLNANSLTDRLDQTFLQFVGHEVSSSLRFAGAPHLENTFTCSGFDVILTTSRERERTAETDGPAEFI